MKRFTFAVCLILALVGAGFAQDKSAQSTAVLDKMRQIDLLNHILPLALQKEQIRKILPVIEKARRDVRLWTDEEAKFLQQNSAKVDKAVKDAVEKGDVPNKELIKELNAMVRMFAMKRAAIASDNTQMVMEAMKTSLNAGQMKVAANALDFKLYNPNIKPEEIKEEDRLRLYVQEVLLDPLAYDLLVKMQSNKLG
jgi:diphthamide synthase (EF-2-diphthine--ammonia ligase)